jgi:acetylornithine deacetylase
VVSNVENAQAVIHSLLPGAQKFLCDIIAMPSLPGREEPLVEFCAQVFEGLADVRKAPLSDTIRSDPEYSDPVASISYESRHNLICHVPGTAAGRSLILNAHLDVVPPSHGQPEPFSPGIVDGVVYGRGACDDKGQVAVIYLLLLAMKHMGVQLLGDLTVHLVAEEENGGNGTLSLVREGIAGDAAVVLEPTELKVAAATRGALWFRITCEGDSAHSAYGSGCRSALDMAMEIAGVMKGYHGRLLAESRGITPFDQFEDPTPLTFGRLSGGDWPAMVPRHAVLEGVLGFLPNRTRDQVKEELVEALAGGLAPATLENTRVDFTFAHDPSIVHAGQALVTSLVEACGRAGVRTGVCALNACSDAWFYNAFADIPAVTFGPGNIADAHGADERIAMTDVAAGARILLEFAQDWCGVSRKGKRL